MQKQLTLPEMAEILKKNGHNITMNYLSQLCRQGRIDGAWKCGEGRAYRWLIPESKSIKIAKKFEKKLVGRSSKK